MELINGMSTSETLRKHELKATETRKAILELFQVKHYALSLNEVEKLLDNAFDRVTVYRTLKSFEDKGLLHIAEDGSGTTKYALCGTHCHGEDGHHHHHMHFHCTSCEKTTCLESNSIPHLDALKGYQVDQIVMYLKGVCKECLHTKQK